MIKKLLVPIVAFTFMALGITPAEAAVPSIPIRCGMQVTTDVNLYLARDLNCRTKYAVQIFQDNASDESGTPHVSIDLRGHTLWGGVGSDTAIETYNYPNVTVVTVANGRIEHWTRGVTGGGRTVIRDVKFVGNQQAFYCWESCEIYNTYFKNNRLGFSLSSESGGLIKDSTFTGNDRAVWVAGMTSSIVVQRSNFGQNGIAVEVSEARATLTSNYFADSGVAVKVTSTSNDSPCPRLTGNTFVRNRVNVEGTSC